MPGGVVLQAGRPRWDAKPDNQRAPKGGGRRDERVRSHKGTVTGYARPVDMD